MLGTSRVYPRGGEKRARQAAREVELHPDGADSVSFVEVSHPPFTEAITLLSCRDVLRERPRVCFAALYTGMRRSELERLTAVDVDLGTI